MPIILATREAKTREDHGSRQDGQKSLGDPISMEKSRAWWRPVIAENLKIGPGWPGKKVRSSKITRAKRSGGVAQVVQLLLSKHEVLS
jgi:hypothetical protein